MKKLPLLFLFAIACCQIRAQSEKEKQQLKSIILQAYESVDQPTRQWLATVSPAGDIDTVYIKSKLKERLTMGQQADVGSVFAFMIAFQKILNKETREDRKAGDLSRRMLLASKEAKLQMQNEAIDQGMKEAKERADRAMDAATTNLVMGIASGLMQIGFTPTIKASKEKETVAEYIKKLQAQLLVLKKGGK